MRKLFLLILLAASGVLAAREDSTLISAAGRDTLLRSDLYPKKNDTYRFNPFFGVAHPIDSGLADLEQYNLIQRRGEEYFNTGNTGSPAYGLLFHLPSGDWFHSGFRRFEPYAFRKDSLKYYTVKRPYTELSYTLGLRTEQIFNGKFAASIKQVFDFGVEFNRISSKGEYARQNTNDNGFHLYGIYRSRNGRWGIHQDLLYNSFRVAENGGLGLDLFSADTSLPGSLLAPVRLREAETRQREVFYRLLPSFHLGKKVPVKEADTLEAKSVVIPEYSFRYRLEVGRERYDFQDYAPDSSYYLDFWQGADSARYSMQILRLRNGLEWQWSPARIRDKKVQWLNLMTEAGVMAEYLRISQTGRVVNSVPVSVYGKLSGNPLSGSKIHYLALARLYLSGYNQADAEFRGEFGLDAGRAGKIEASGSVLIRKPDWIFAQFLTTTGGWDQEVKRQFMFEAAGRYTLEKYGLSAGFRISGVKNMYYFDASRRPVMDDQLLYLTAHVSHRYGIRGFYIENELWYQRSFFSGAVRLPEWMSRHGIRYERRVFKKALLLSIGSDLRYYSSVNGYGYFPLSGQFYAQDGLRMKFYPVWDVYLSMKIKSVRIFLKGYNLSQGFGQKGYYMSALNPAQSRGFAGGVKWRFFE